LGRKFVKVWGCDLAAVGPHVGIAEVVSHDEKNVRPFILRESDSRHAKNEAKRSQGSLDMPTRTSGKIPSPCFTPGPELACRRAGHDAVAPRTDVQPGRHCVTHLTSFLSALSRCKLACAPAMSWRFHSAGSQDVASITQALIQIRMFAAVGSADLNLT
jgi:hypothetical protein